MFFEKKATNPTRWSKPDAPVPKPDPPTGKASDPPYGALSPL
ncbi:hypothetical protein GCM10010182_83620 [Actinomadura cremea]|nr:hypothetical protein GCM10010182_83620 [Actinomadura cremea]